MYGGEAPDGVTVELMGVRQTFYPPLLSMLLEEAYKAILALPTNSFSDEKITAVNGVCLRLRHSHCFALLGHNGAGKTTTIKIATAQLAPSSGDVSVHGLSVKLRAGAVRKPHRFRHALRFVLRARANILRAAKKLRQC